VLAVLQQILHHIHHCAPTCVMSCCCTGGSCHPCYPGFYTPALAWLTALPPPAHPIP
jgi:hypothetical protein